MPSASSLRSQSSRRASNTSTSMGTSLSPSPSHSRKARGVLVGQLDKENRSPNVYNKESHLRTSTVERKSVRASRSSTTTETTEDRSVSSSSSS
eukprot:CAMPEP_0174242716 /NCGR_PEP_ID=MMETSP0417-20130205/28880_1 /TAXON_ID=242541 /ORGANISM="Mayorella sp, Strain BSH-02190019" /LENGTH=93 /DNA_ID=CAMNT_0015322143 /DNA_START=228 /DNA_END=505 /DNA_ORIENTATION=-